MGCDIHLFAEAKKGNQWVSLEKWVVDEDGNYDTPYGERFYNGGRNYNLFAALVGVRDSSFSSPPLPITQPNKIPKDSCKEIKRVVRQWAGDGHSHSHLTLAQIKSYDWTPWEKTCEDFLKEVLPKMSAVNVGEDDVRIVFFFDN